MCLALWALLLVTLVGFCMDNSRTRSQVNFSPLKKVDAFPKINLKMQGQFINGKNGKLIVTAETSQAPFLY